MQIHQPTGNKQPVSILVEAPITNLVGAEDALQYQERMLDFRPHLRLGSIFRSFLSAQRPITSAFLVGEVFGTRRMLGNNRALASQIGAFHL